MKFKKNIIINQFIGLGDILFIIPICDYYYNLGHNIIFPINEEFLNIQKNFKHIQFVNKNNYHIDYESNEIVEYEDYTILPLRFSNNILNNGNPETCMSDKYQFLNLPLDIWKNLKWERDFEKENELYYDVLGLKDGEEYNLINTSFSMDKNINLNLNNGLKNINMKILKDFNLLDWYKVITNASSIHTVGTSIIFIIEVMKTTNDLNLYRREGEKDFSFYLYLLEKKYNLKY
jgi:hypothetical protein